MQYRTLFISQRYLMLPVANDGGWFLNPENKQYLTLSLHGQTLLELETVLSSTPRAWLPLDLDPWMGETLDLALEGGHEQLIELLTLQREEAVLSEACAMPDRPLFHFTPLGGFMNDPNGLTFVNGRYHLFAQSNPAGFGMGNTHWLHAVSSDLLHWKHLPCALLPDETGRMYSGGSVVDKDNTSGLGVDPAHPPVLLFYTAAGSKSRQSRGKPFEIAAAYSLDDGMTFTKLGAPLIRHMSFMNRDPKVVWVEEMGCWIMAVYLDNDVYRFFRADDLLHWSFLQDIRLDHAAECPDLFRLPIEGQPGVFRWILWGSPDCYIVGQFQDGFFRADASAVEGPVHQLLHPYRILAQSPGGYAAQTFTSLPEDRVVQLAWIRSTPQTGSFAGCMSVPNEMRLVPTPEGLRLSRLPIKELHTMSEQHFAFTNGGIEELSHVPPQYMGEAMDLSISMTLLPARSLAFSIRGILLVYHPDTQRLLLPWGAYPVAPVNGELSLRVLVDRCSMEIYSGDGLFSLAVAVKPDPADVSIRVVDIDPATGIDFSVHRYPNMWTKE